MSFVVIVLATSVLFLAIVTIILLIVGPTILLQPRRRTSEFYRMLGLPTTPTSMDLSYEEINIIAEGGIRLNSWLVKASSPVRGTVLYLHGVADCKIDGIRLARLLHDNHYNVLLYDSRRHGMSEGNYCTYGFYEKHDVPRIITYLESRTDVKLGDVGLFGTSMGAAISIQAAGIDKRIRAVVAENSFATLRSIFDDYQKRMIKLPFHYLRNFVIKRSELIARFKARDVSPLDLVGEIGIPILFIYGTNDHLIKPEYTKQLFERKLPPKELYPIEGASHNDTWKIAGKAYETIILHFLERYL